MKRENIVVASVGRGIAIPSRVPDVHLLKNSAISLQQSKLSIVLNASYGRYLDGDSNWNYLAPTPGSANKPGPRSISFIPTPSPSSLPIPTPIPTPTQSPLPTPSSTPTITPPPTPTPPPSPTQTPAATASPSAFSSAAPGPAAVLPSETNYAIAAAAIAAITSNSSNPNKKSEEKKQKHKHSPNDCYAK